MIVKSYRAPRCEPNVCFVDIECVKVPAPKGWAAKNRFKTFMVGLGLNGRIFVAQSDDEAELIRWLDARLKPVVFYSGTREFDRMVLEGRWVHARTAHATRPGNWPVLPATFNWVRLRDPIRSSERSKDVFWKRSKDILAWPNVDAEAVRFHCMLDVLELMMTMGERK